ncbi:MAG: hypothetical protein WAK20_11480 [Candidatus Acidiferrum sp.]
MAVVAVRSEMKIGGLRELKGLLLRRWQGIGDEKSALEASCLIGNPLDSLYRISGGIGAFSGFT